jgi:hypothetical protein
MNNNSQLATRNSYRVDFTSIGSTKASMSSKTNTRIVLQSRPKGPIEPDTFKTDRSERVPTEKDLKDGEVVVRVMWISLVSRSGL